MKRFLLTLTAISVLTGFANAGLTGTHSGKITNIYANQNGNYLFRVTNLDGSTSTTLYDLWIPSTATGSKNMLSVVLAAWQNGTRVSFGASAWTSTMDQALDLWVTQ